jgi:cell shape-determining protein MreC
MDENRETVSLKMLENENERLRQSLMEYFGLSPERYALGLIRTAWHDLAGLPGRFSHPERIAGRTLYVKADNHVQASELKLYSSVIIQRIESQCHIKLDKMFIS